MGIFSKSMNKEGAIAGMVSGLVFTFGYIFYFKLMNPEANVAENWLFGISPEGIGVVGMVLNFAIAIAVSKMTASPPVEIAQVGRLHPRAARCRGSPRTLEALEAISKEGAAPKGCRPISCLSSAKH